MVVAEHPRVGVDNVFDTTLVSWRKCEVERFGFIGWVLGWLRLGKIECVVHFGLIAIEFAI